MGRRRSKNPKRNTHCLRLTDRQEDLLVRYTSLKGLESEMDAVRLMIDGLDDWFRRQESRASAHMRRDDGARVKPGTDQADGAQPKPVSAADESISFETDGDSETPVGDFGGRPSVGLPLPRHDGLE